MAVAALLVYYRAYLNTTNSALVQAIATVILIGVTAVYVILTDSSVEATTRQADAAEKTTKLVLQEHQDQLDFAPQIVSEAINDTRSLIAFWKAQAQSQSPFMPDTQALARTAIPGALSSARRVSRDCALLLVQVAGLFRNAQFEMEKLRVTPIQPNKTDAAKRAEDHLLEAGHILKRAEDCLTPPRSNAL